jgi:hypothetical protein
MTAAELLYINCEQENMQFNTSLKDLFTLVEDDVIDIDNIMQVNMQWEKHHHNSIWCNLATRASMQESMERAADGYDNPDLNFIWPNMRIDVDLFRKAIQYERQSIPYECFLSFKRKYIHVKLRVKEAINE